MGTAATVAVSAATAVLKKVFDDLYDVTKKSSKNFLTRSRADVKESIVARAVHSVTKIKTLWNIEKEVSLYEFYYPTSIEFSQDVKKRVNGVKDFGNVGNFVIQGTAGQGKSIFLRYLCGQELDPRYSTSRLPLFVELRRIRSDLGLQDLLLQALERFKLPATVDAWRTLAENGKVTLLLDAFDEVDPALSERTIAEIESLADIYRDSLQILVTSRPDADIQKSNVFRVLKLAPLTHSDHQPFLKKICSDKEQTDSLMKVLRASSTEVSSLLTTPLMLTLLVILYKSVQTIPDTVPKFYEELFDVLFYRHDHSKPGFRRKRFTTLDDGSVKKVFSGFCFFTRLDNLGVLTSSQFESCCDRASEACGIVVDSSSLRNELVKTICLMQEDGFELSFIHKSVAQYYAAAFIAKSGDEFGSQFYALAKTQPSWELELRFLSEIDAYRYARYFEIPLLDQFGAEVGVDFDSPRRVDTEKMERYFVESVNLVAAGPREENTDPSEEHRNFVGWSSDLAQSNWIRREAVFWWVWPVMSHIESAFASAGKKFEPRHDHEFIPISRFREDLSPVAATAAESVLERLRKRRRKAAEIVETEVKKTAILSGLLKASASTKR